MKYLFCILPALAFAIPKITLQDAKQQMIAYHDSGIYELEQWQAVKPAISYLIHHKFDDKMAVVFDVDETLLSNFKYMRQYSFGGNSAIFHEIEMKADAEVIAATKALYDTAIKQGLTVFIITGRQASERKATEINLAKYHIDSYKGLYMWSGKKPSTVKKYKSEARCAIEHSGYKIVLNVGDQASDLVGPCNGSVLVKLPNPFYNIAANQPKRVLK